jgi:hypothetical protein
MLTLPEALALALALKYYKLNNNCMLLNGRSPGR